MKQPAPETPLYDNELVTEPSSGFSRLLESVPGLIVQTRAALNKTPTLEKAEKNVFYLAYGSNLCASTFLGRRQIRPVSSTNVVVPSLTLTFGLPGIPYLEPCFANVRYTAGHEEDPNDGWWHGGLIGVVYEVTPADYAKIFATEGGGAGYQLVKVPAKPLDGSAEIEACTLLASQSRERGSYAQPSLRYLNLLRTGAREHGLPEEYRAWLAGLQEYRKTTWRQKVGAAVWAVTWMPLFIFIVILSSLFTDRQGRSPKCLQDVQNAVKAAMWCVYDGGFRSVFGDGERTVDGAGEGERLLPVE